MAYEAHSITAITDVPALVGAFAAANGFDTDLSDPNKPIVTCPGDSNSVEENIAMQMQALVSGTNNQNHNVWWAQYAGSNSELEDTRAIVYSPKYNGSAANNPTVALPTKLHIFGTAVDTDYPFIACVIEYGFNVYRHIYFGKMEARGNYTGREVISASNGQITQSASTQNWFDPLRSHLFTSHQSATSVPDVGGVRIIHADNSDEWRQFRQTTVNSSSPMDEYAGNEVIGGFNDGPNDGFVMRGKSPFAGSNQLVPINLYAPESISGDTSFRPIGRPPGVRMVNMEDLEPGAQIVVGNETWRVFPDASKNSAITITQGANNFPTYESSYYLGYAYLEEDAP